MYSTYDLVTSTVRVFYITQDTVWIPQPIVWLRYGPCNYNPNQSGLKYNAWDLMYTSHRISNGPDINSKFGFLRASEFAAKTLTKPV